MTIPHFLTDSAVLSLRGGKLLVATAAAISVTMSSEGGATDTPITLVGIARDFVADHPDFSDLAGDHGGLIAGIVDEELLANAKPRLTSEGTKVIHESFDAEGRAIAPHVADASLADTAAKMGVKDRGGVESENSFASWFTDQPGLNLSTQVNIMFRPMGGGVYVFDTAEDPLYQARGGFFPIDNMLYGNEQTGGRRHNYNFSFELHADFEFRSDLDQFIQVDGNSEIWVFIDGALVIDLGGVRPSDSRGQFFDLSRLEAAEGSQHTLSIFIANRHRGTPKFRLESNLLINEAHSMSVTPTFD